MERKLFAECSSFCRLCRNTICGVLFKQEKASQHLNQEAFLNILTFVNRPINLNKTPLIKRYTRKLRKNNNTKVNKGNPEAEQCQIK